MSEAPDGKGKSPPVDAAALRARYAEERRKRIRPEGNGQYVAIEGDLARYAEDPYVEPGFTRAPRNELVDVVVVGGGFSGLLTAGRLREAGVDNLRVIERGGDFGGTWYWNRYPGAACDVESYIYFPILEEIGYIPSEKYAKQPEIWKHTQAIAKHFGLYEKALFQTDVTEINWDDDLCRWIIRTNHGDRIQARHVCLGVGAYARPKLPGIPGVEGFQGRSFHTCRWDYDYTGGDPKGALEKLVDKRVALIGTGATAIQCVPHLGQWAKQLFVFQRTPSSVSYRGNRPTDPAWARSLKPGWHKERMRNFHAIMTGARLEQDLVADGWTQASAAIANPALLGLDPQMADDPAQLRQLADFMVMEDVRRRVDEIVEDPETAESLKPYYNFMCKRPGFHDEYLQTFNRPNVTLIDTKGRGVDEISGNALVFDGKRYEVDLLIYGTGFEQNAPADRAGDFELRGRAGATLSEAWADGRKTLHGIATRNFPNLFIVGSLSQTGGSANFPYALGEQCVHVAQVIKRCIDADIRSIEVTEAAVTAWTKTIAEKAPPIRRFLEECTPGYFNQEGKINGAFFLDLYGGGVEEYFKVLADWRTDGFDRDLEIRF